LAPATLARIEAGLRKFGGKYAEPFLVILRNNATARSIESPVPTITAGGGHVGLCEPFIFAHQRRGNQATSINEPIQTVTATSSDFALVEPFVLGQQSGAVPRSVKDPLNTIAAKGAISLIEPFIVPFFGERKGQDPRTHSLDDPLPAVTSHGAGALVESFVMPVNHGSSDKRSYSLERPMPTVTSVDAWGIVEPFLAKYNGTGKANSIDEPLDTVTAKDRFGLVETESGPVKVDIRFRMLRPHELARAMSFDDGYKFSGTREQQVKQIGNAVAVRTAEALCREVLAS
jgi:DNA (cytosine-5)-methyltransferase 1